MSVKREDNFGFYCIDNDLGELEFFCYIKLQSKPKICVRCHQNVRLLKHIQICAVCSQALEYGASSDPALPL
jgi:predicted amidophosphoribosyltransferase